MQHTSSELHVISLDLLRRFLLDFLMVKLTLWILPQTVSAMWAHIAWFRIFNIPWNCTVGFHLIWVLVFYCRSRVVHFILVVVSTHIQSTRLFMVFLIFLIQNRLQQILMLRSLSYLPTLVNRWLWRVRQNRGILFPWIVIRSCDRFFSGLSIIIDASSETVLIVLHCTLVMLGWVDIC